MKRRSGSLESTAAGAVRETPGRDGQRSFTPTVSVADLLEGKRPDPGWVRLSGRVRRSVQGGRFRLADAGYEVTVEVAGGAVPAKAAWVGLEGRWDAAAGVLQEARLLFCRPSLLSPLEALARGLPEAAFVCEPGRLSGIRIRSRLLKEVRAFLDGQGFLEVQTPFLHVAPEAANVHQYTTEGVGGRRYFLRTDPEEYLKRYLTAGLDAVFEVSVNVRGEAPDADRLQEFTSVECYRRFATMEDVLDLLDQLIRQVLTKLRKSPEAQLREVALSFVEPPARRTFAELVAEHTGIALQDHPTAESLAAAVQGLEGGFGLDGPKARLRGAWLETLLESHVLPRLKRPTYVLEFPVEAGLSACPCAERPQACLRGELYLPGGWELAQLYENLTESEPLRRRLEQRVRRRVANGYPAVPLDQGLLCSAELGMPPMGGFALGVDRLLMLIQGDREIGAGLLFPREGFSGRTL